MPPRFRAENFRFDPSTSMPDHIEGDPRKDERHPQKIWLSEDGQAIAIDIDRWSSALIIQRARFRALEENGQQITGVFIKLPGQAE